MQQGAEEGFVAPKINCPFILYFVPKAMIFIISLSWTIQQILHQKMLIINP